MGNDLGLGAFGVWTFDFEDHPAALVRDSVQELEELGWPAVWVPEVGGREAFSLAGYLLAVTERMSVVNGIAQITAREAAAARGGGVLLADAYPGRHVLGLGLGAGRPGVKPLTAVAEYLDAFDGAEEVRRVLAAYGPKMLELARDRTSGAHTYKVNVAHTVQAREILGPDAFLGVEHAVLLETDPDRARTVAREHLVPYLSTPYNLAKFRRLGYTEDDLTGGGSDRFVDDMVFWGDLDTVVDRLRTQQEAGADHVGVQVIGVRAGETAMPQWRALAEALSPGV
ncbi:TIGR03620 family F420-dependent LLM class oxidoreductase [Saccharothrix variisporea]|uniref:Putative F420-dependent oxidoreductase n=1 Tax=Saccharothrix variisporea TaxID=543527 RepID=A0A495X051_9PSEU|nr:TIGR03620 family F420-dependent LLM class oxidoreductase [Saccharothrix variisporea]RKT67039.1 putative F420-dependent oxidoreductase [Saccharothrix variisporea]